MPPHFNLNAPLHRLPAPKNPSDQAKRLPAVVGKRFSLVLLLSACHVPSGESATCGSPGKPCAGDESGLANDTGGEEHTDTGGSAEPDSDNDGHPDASDCAPNDPTIFPDAAELCNHIDDDCDGETDEVVASTETAGFASIAEALAGATDGGTVVVCPGEHRETLRIERPLRIRGLDGAGATRIIAERGAPVVVVEAASFHLDGLTLTGGAGERVDGNRLGGGVHGPTLRGNSSIDNCVIEANEADFGGGLYLAGSGRVTLDQTEVSSNTATESGGGMYVDAIDLELRGVTLNGNRADGAGGGMLAEFAMIDADSASTVRTNTATIGGGLVLVASTWSGATFNRNTASEQGGSAYLTQDALLQSTEIGNSTTGGSGGGIACSGDCTILDLEIEASEADECGGAIRLAGSGSPSWRIEGVFLTNNRAGTSGGGICTGIGDLTLENVQITDNQADFGGGISLAASATASALTVSDNGAEYSGGGIYFDPDSSLTGDDRSAISIAGNTAEFGGGTFMESNATLHSAEITGNSSIYVGGGTLAYGDGVFLRDVHIQSNESEGAAGIYVDNGASLHVSDAHIETNRAGTNGGGGVGFNGDSLILEDCNMESGARDNTPEDVRNFRNSRAYSYGTLSRVTCSSSGCTGS